MIENKTYNRRNASLMILVILLAIFGLVLRLGYIMILKSEYYGEKAQSLHERERAIKSARGIIYDANYVPIAANKPVCTISVIYSQIRDPENVISILSNELGISEDKVRKRVEKVSSIERVKSNVDKKTADKIREYNLDGVMVDEDYQRYYPYGSLASKVIGFTGGDNQGIIGLEVKYDKYLKGLDGTILTLTSADGVEIENASENRLEPVKGNSLRLSLDIKIQEFAEQVALNVMETKSAKNVKLIVMNPQNGEIYAMVNAPEFDLNNPYKLTDEILMGMDESSLDDKMTNELLNNMWRNASISDTYEPGSAFKIITSAAAFEEGLLNIEDSFFCPGYKRVEDRLIRCHKAGGHGSQNFLDGIKNSCNPVFMEIGARLGVDLTYKHYKKLGLFEKTNIDLPGEASSIMHKKDIIGAVELATMSFGQSFQITPLQLLTSTSAIINGGKLVTPHLGVDIISPENDITNIHYPLKEGIVSKETGETMKMLLEQVVYDGTGKRAYLPGFKVGGKTATSEKLPRRNGKYISSFIGFAPANDPQIIAVVLIDEPVGIYYGGTIAAPVISELFDNVLPYLGIEESYNEEEKDNFNIGEFTMPNLVGKTKEDLKDINKIYNFREIYEIGEGDQVVEQFPLAGEKLKFDSDIILYLDK